MRVLVIFKHKEDYMDFSVSELKSVLTIIGVDIRSAFAAQYNLVGKPVPKHPKDINRRNLDSWPFINLYIPDEKICLLDPAFERSVSIKTFIEVIAEGQSYDELFSFGMNNKRLQEEMDIADETFAFFIQANMRVMKEEEKQPILNRLPDPW